MSTESTPDVLLRGKKVRRRYAKRSSSGTSTFPTVTVWIPQSGEHYKHAEASVNWGGRYHERITLRFQCNRVDSRDPFGEMSTGRSRSRGFLATSLPYSGNYGGSFEHVSIEAGVEIGWTLALLKDAQDAFHARWIREPGDGYRSRPQAAKLCYDDDTLLALIIGMQQLGIDVRLYSKDLRSKRERRIEGREWERRMAPVRAQEETMLLTIRAGECTGPYPDAPDYGGECGATYGTCPKHARTLAVAS